MEVRSPHFRVLTNGSQDDDRHVAREFEQMRFVFAHRNPVFRLEGGAPMVVFAAQDEPTAKSLEPYLWKEKGAKPAGVFNHGWEKYAGDIAEVEIRDDLPAPTTRVPAEP
jgi:hypothetical protein